LYVFFPISHARHRIKYVNVTAHPTAAWKHRPRYLIRDRDRISGRGFLARAQRLGIETVLTPVRAPQANAVAERWIGTIQRECLDHIIPLSARHLRRIVQEFVEYHTQTRPHRTLDLQPPAGPRPRQGHGRVVVIPILSGLHHRYERAAA
jgi:transposase InsO family protein